MGRDMDIARQPRSRTRKVAPALVVAILAVVAVTSLFRSQASAAPAVERASIWTSRVERGDLVREVPVQGTLVPEHVQWLSAISAARVAHIAVRAGAVVEPDTVVVELENADLELARLEAEHQAANAEAALIQLDVSTAVAEKQQEATLAGLRADLRDADRHASAAERLAPQGLMSDLDHNDAMNKAHGLSERLETETSRAAVIASGRERELAAQRSEDRAAPGDRAVSPEPESRRSRSAPASTGWFRTSRSRTGNGWRSAPSSRRSRSRITSRPK